MKITLIKTKGKKEIITRYTLEEVAYAIHSGWRKHNVTYLREVYHLMNKERSLSEYRRISLIGRSISGCGSSVWWPSGERAISS